MLKPDDRMGDWRIERQLGAGGMGAVFLARSVISDKIRAALKVSTAEASDEGAARFVREIESIANLSHPNIVRAKGFGRDAASGAYWLAMDLVEGEDLSKITARGAADPADVARWGHLLAVALAYAHSRGVAHRDLKPANILISDGQPVLVDFGIASQADGARLTSTGMIGGTPAYLAPEVFGDTPVDPMRADIYALGQVLYELVTGAPAFESGEPTLSESQRFGRLVSAKMRTTALDPGPGVPSPLREAIIAATEPDPARRVGSMEALSRLLLAERAPAVTTEPPLRAPAAATAPPRRGVAPMALGLGAMALVVLGVGAVAAVVVVGLGLWVLVPGAPPPEVAVASVAAPVVEPAATPPEAALPAGTVAPEAALQAGTTIPEAPVAPPAVVSNEGADTEGGLPREEIRKVLQADAGVKACFDDAAPAQRGKVVMKFTILPDGAVADAKAKQTSVAGGVVTRCVEGQIAQMKFAVPPGSASQIVTVPVTAAMRE